MDVTEAFVGEIRLFSMNWVPDGWLPCDGRSLPVNGYGGLAAVLGDQFGGDGWSTFNLPDLRGRVPVGQGINPQTKPPVTYTVGNYGGLEAVALTAAQVPPHTHGVIATTEPGTTAAVSSNLNILLAQSPASHSLYAQTGALTPLAADSVSQEGAGAAHNNMQPSLVLNFCICAAGIFPQRP